MKPIYIIIVLLLSNVCKAQYTSPDFYTQVTFPASYQVGDYIEFASTTPIDVNASGYFEVSISYTRGSIAAAATFLTSISHANSDIWREAGMINANDYVQYKNRNFTVDVNGGRSKFRIRAINTIGDHTPLNVNVKIRSINQVYNWTALNNAGTDNSVTSLQSMTDEWSLYVGSLFSQESAKIALKAISNGNVGIGTESPSTNLEIASPIGATLSLTTKGFHGNNETPLSPKIDFLGYANGSKARISATEQTYDTHGSKLSFFVNDGSSATSLKEMMTINQNSNVGIGVIDPKNKLDVNGTVHAKEVKLDMAGWADFVFHKDYELPTLDEVEKHIRKKGHLPNIPSTKEITENGLSLGESQKLLLQKIEELTLYSIEQNKLGKQQSELLRKQKEEIQNLKHEVSSMRK